MKKLRQKREGTETVTPSVGAKPEKDRVYSAYIPISRTDGIQKWTEHTFDHALPWTEDDQTKFMEVNERLGPYQRVDDMQAMLATLPTDNPEITLHADAIRAIHAEVQAPPIRFTRERLARLDQASEMWAKILLIRDVIPVVREAAVKKAQRKIVNTKNAKADRPGRRTVDHDEIETEFSRLTREGHTRREANGILFARGLANARSTITNITKKLSDSAG